MCPIKRVSDVRVSTGVTSLAVGCTCTTPFCGNCWWHKGNMHTALFCFLVQLSMTCNCLAFKLVFSLVCEDMVTIMVDGLRFNLTEVFLFVNQNS